ncbi:MAG TPA: hypothetical protein VK996_16760 [Ramlibacter sp.]|nr:hypothetical protein [Ramlibacter sp.]
MKAYYLIAPLGVALLAGCTVYRPVAVATPAPAVAYVSPSYVAPSTVIMGAPASDWNLLDSDGDGVANSLDRYPYDSRWR